MIHFLITLLNEDIGWVCFVGFEEILERKLISPCTIGDLAVGCYFLLLLVPRQSIGIRNTISIRKVDKLTKRDPSDSAQVLHTNSNKATTTNTAKRLSKVN